MASPKKKVYVVGVGMTKFEKPGKREDYDYPDMAKEAVTKALADAGLPYTAIQQAAVGYCYGDSGCGQRALYPIGLTGIPVYNVNNACATGSTALVLGKQLIEGGSANCVLALGFEKMDRGSLTSKYTDRVNPVQDHVSVLADRYGITGAPITPQMFGSAGREHMERYGTTADHFAKIAEKNHRHSANNPNSQFRDVYSLEQIKNSRMVYEPLTKLQCCPTSDGSAAAVLASEEFVIRHNLQDKAVLIVAMEMATDLPSTFKEGSCMKMVGYDMTKKAAASVFAKSGYTPQDVDVIELHDCFSANELITYEGLGLCPEGKAGELIDRGDNTYGGKYVINPSGGLISKGHPLGATGLAQCTELCWQLRGLADKRQVPGAKLALQHNLGLGGACVVALYQLGFPGEQRVAPKTMSGLNCEPVFDLIKAEIDKRGAELVKKIKGVLLFKIKGADGSLGEWQVDLKNGTGSVKKGPGLKGDCTVTMKDSDFMEMVSGKLSGQKAFFEGKLKISGNTSLAMKIPNIMPKPKSKL